MCLDKLRIAVHRADVATRGLLQDLDPAGHLRGTLQLDPSDPAPEASALFEGRAGQLQLTARGRYQAGRVDAQVHMPRTAAAIIRRVLNVPLQSSVALDARVSGPPTQLRGALAARLDRGRVHARFSGRIFAPRRGKLHLVMDGVSPRAFVDKAPDVPVSLSGDVRARQRDDGSPWVSARLKTKRAVVKGVRVPPLLVAAQYDGKLAKAQVRATEPGLRLDANVSTTLPRGEDGEHDIEWTAQARVADLSKLIAGATGRGSAQGSGRLTFVANSPPRVSVNTNARASGVSAYGVRFQNAKADAHVEGTVGRLHGEATVKARKVAFGGHHAREVRLTAQGATSALHVKAHVVGANVPNVNGTFTLRTTPNPELHDVKLELTRNGTTARVRALEIAKTPRGLRTRGLRVTGLGELSVSGKLAPRGFDFRANGENVNLTRVARLLNITFVRGGHVTFKADLRDRHGKVSGTLSLAASGFSAGRIDNGTAHLNASIEDNVLDATGAASLGSVARLGLVAKKVRLPERGKIRPDQLRGQLLVSANMDLADASRLLADRSHFVAQGTAFLEIRLKQTQQRTRARFELSTHQLQLTEHFREAKPETRQEALARQPLRLRGLDLDVSGVLADSDDESRVSVEVLDQHGPLARVQVAAKLPLRALLRHPEHAKTALRSLPLNAEVELPERELQSWPAQFRPPSLLGKISAHARLSGPIDSPALSVRVLGRKMRSKSNRRVSPANVRASFSFADERGSAAVLLSHGDGDLSVKSNFSAALPALLAGTSPNFHGNLRLTAHNYALDRIPMLSARELSGRLDGSLMASGLGTDPKVTGELDVRDLHVARVDLSRAALRVKAGDGDLRASAELEHPGGRLEAKLDAGIAWQRGLFPKLDRKRILSARVQAKGFRAGTFLPLVSGSVAKLDGRVDADLSAKIGPHTHNLRGHAELRKGVVQIPAIGQELHDIRAKLQLENDGAVYLRDVSARGLVGRVRAAAAGRLSGFDLVRFNASAQIEENDKMPLTIEGVSLGNMWGSAKVEGRTTGPRDLDLDVDVSSFHLEMPSLAPRHVQSLEPAQDVQVGVRRESGFVELPLQPLDEEDPDPLELRVRVHLGDDVWLRQGATARVKLDGAVTLDIAKQAQARGTVHIRRGRIDVSGKMFEIDKGTLTFDGEPTNPILVATARWESPDGVVVFAKFSGPVKSGTLRLHSDPSLSENQIFALLLFGSTDGMAGSGSVGDGGKASTAASVGGGVATKGLNAAFRRLTDVDVTARIDTSDTQPRPELAVQVTPRVTAEVGYKLGEPTPGKAPDRTLFTLDFRLSQRWSLATTFGDRGSSLLELLWRYRY